jgi:hypothetical protein
LPGFIFGIIFPNIKNGKEIPAMSQHMKEIISSAIIRILRPLIKILLKNDIPYGTFSELAKWVYVDVALHDQAIPGRRTTISRASVITGLSRKEVKRLQEISEPGDIGASAQYNRAARVISGWLKDERFTDGGGEPRELPFEGDGDSFSALVKAYSGDVPPRAVRDELLRVSIIAENNGKLRLQTKGYIVRKGDAERLSIMGTDVGELLSTLHHNITHNPTEAYLQRKVSYDNIPDESMAQLRNLIHDHGREFVESMNNRITQFDRDTNPSLKGNGKNRAGIGIFYFEE